MERRDEQSGTGIRQDPAIGGAERMLGPSVIFDSVGADERATQGHVQRGSHSIVGHVGDQFSTLPDIGDTNPYPGCWEGVAGVGAQDSSVLLARRPAAR